MAGYIDQGLMLIGKAYKLKDTEKLDSIDWIKGLIHQTLCIAKEDDSIAFLDSNFSVVETPLKRHFTYILDDLTISFSVVLTNRSVFIDILRQKTYKYICLTKAFKNACFNLGAEQNTYSIIARQ